MQLQLFARANTLIRRVPRIAGIPTIDEHAMRLTAKLALGSSSRVLAEMVVEITKNPGVTQRDLAKVLKLSQPTVSRYAKVLHRVGVLEDTANMIVAPKFGKVIRKYVLGEDDGSSDST
jgi:predicted transcriptional regulator